MPNLLSFSVSGHSQKNPPSRFRKGIFHRFGISSDTRKNGELSYTADRAPWS